MKKKLEEILYPYRNHSIAIYGLGSQTKELLTEMESKFHIAGLLDGYCTEGEMYGMPILPLEELPIRKVTVVIVAARPGSCRIIVNRISEFCRENNIRIFNTDGKELSGNASKKELSLNVGKSRKEFLREIDAHEIISFDVFDTLLMRKTLYPSDVFEIIEKRLPEPFREKMWFSRERQFAERELSRESVPDMDKIYEYLGERNKLSKAQTEQLKKAEWEAEKQLMILRQGVYSLLQYAVEKGKRVYLVSDMYFSSQQIEELLKKNGITGYEKIYVSCECGTTKSQKLFSCLRKEAGAASVLHIGDDKSADVDGAARHGIDGCQVFSAFDMFDRSGLMDKLNGQDRLEERLKLGMFIARFFNSPFFSETGNVTIRKPEDLGYLLFAPIITDFTLWMWHKVKENREETVLFGARDGYLVRQLFDELQQKAGRIAESIYFLTSRMCAVLAGIYTEKDVEYAAGMSFSGSVKEMLKTRFLLKDDEIGDIEQNIYNYYPLILSRAEKQREHYLAYIEGMKLERGKKAFFDFVSSGTCQLFLEKILGEKMQGYYFITVEDEYDEKKRLCTYSYYPQSIEDNKEGIYADYFILENILTSPQPSLRTFDENGRPDYLKEERSGEELAFLEEVHRGIKEYFRDYTDMIVETDADGRKLSEKMFELIHCIPVDNEIFFEMKWTDSFYGRKVELREMI